MEEGGGERCFFEIKFVSSPTLPQRGAADAEIEVSSVENTELERSPFKA